MRRALELNPNYPRAHSFYSALLSGEGRHAEALRESELALQLEPLSLQFNMLAGQALMQAGHYDDAVPQLTRVLEIYPNAWVPELILGKTLERQGKLDEAMQRYSISWQHSFGATEPLGRIGHLYAVRGNAATILPSAAAALNVKELRDRNFHFLLATPARSQRTIQRILLPLGLFEPALGPFESIRKCCRTTKNIDRGTLMRRRAEG